MAEQNTFTQQSLQDEPELRRNARDPQGVMQKNLKIMLYIGAVVVVVLALVLSSVQKAKTPGPSKQTAAQPVVQDNTASNVEALADSRSRRTKPATSRMLRWPRLPATAHPRSRQRVVAIARPASPCRASRVAYCPPPQGANNNGQPRRSRLCNSKSSSSRQKSANGSLRHASSRISPTTARHSTNNSGYRWPSSLRSRRWAILTSRQTRMLPPSRPARNRISPPAEASVHRHRHRKLPCRIPPTSLARRSTSIPLRASRMCCMRERRSIPFLMNRLDGDAPGPVKVLVSNPVYSHDHQHVLIPDGTIVLGEAKKIGTVGFGQQRRMAVAFHRMIMPDGYSVDLDQFQGLDQIGEEGLKDKVNNHYFEIFGTSIALGVISGAAQITQGGSVYGSSGSQSFTTGAAASVAQSATTVLDRFIQIPPTITIREGHRVKVYFIQDMLLPSYTNHTIPQSF